MEEVLFDVQLEVREVRRGEVKDLDIVRSSAEGMDVLIELPRNLIQIKEGKHIRLIVSESEVEEVDGLFACTIYKVEKQKERKNGFVKVYGSIGGLQVRIEAENEELQRKIKMGDKVFIGIKVL
ncbi:MAG: DNA-directed RNA polymerase subunit 8 [Candidatus Nezhaarchaeota archaeon]|nr:DNA-directed RNA polymerase subunit 8 [Candidatus Nezhaarchaeota archaeon]MCX8141919.1 DNA-directed RNA polymerase subunit 8 [Candidatus Nezhaarchaeota archaeon]MDW8050300.1 DNA-directed RNA polymerase subunit G [Nitrososphaerota archaeon]